MAYGGPGTLLTLSGRLLTPIGLAMAQEKKGQPMDIGKPLFLQISDAHIGFNKEATPDVATTLKQTIDLVTSMPAKPALAIHTGDITQLSKAQDFDLTSQLLFGLPVSKLHTVTPKHDVTDGSGAEYFNRLSKAPDNKDNCSFDHDDVHFVGLVNVMHFKSNVLDGFGEDQLAWLEQEISRAVHRSRSSHTCPCGRSTNLGGGETGDAPQATGYLQYLGSLTVLNGHIHHIASKVRGNIAFHTARSIAFPQPPPGSIGPLTVARHQLPRMPGVTTVSFAGHPGGAAVHDSTIA
jgi:3',5'-cyclic AMP phosphodiesterase CpdA